MPLTAGETTTMPLTAEETTTVPLTAEDISFSPDYILSTKLSKRAELVNKVIAMAPNWAVRAIVV